ncbi:MAG TPA: hypothetical protein VFU42_07930, partial [Candidatus Deferrimicrobiaceae bacterium]|nr:hypothetical protein [Candidatus Deferrimicrobiaceae bacterium]
DDPQPGQRGRMDIRTQKKDERYGIDDFAIFLIVKKRTGVDQERTEQIGKDLRSRLQPEPERHREDQQGEKRDIGVYLSGPQRFVQEQKSHGSDQPNENGNPVRPDQTVDKIQDDLKTDLFEIRGVTEGGIDEKFLVGNFSGFDDLLPDGKMDSIVAGKHLVEEKAGDGQEKDRDDDLLKKSAF